jgi:hypothetical protein
MSMAKARRALSAVVAAILIASVCAQAPAGPASPQRSDTLETQQDLYARLTASQQQSFDNAMLALKEKRYADALEAERKLLAEMPGDPLLAEYASEAALNIDAPAFAVTQLQSVVKSAPGDWRAALLLVRACGQTANGTCRNEEMEHLANLHHGGVLPAGVASYLVEKVKVGPNTVAIGMFLEPWGRYGAHAMAEVTDDSGKRLQRVFLESADFDQPLFAKENPAAAAKGLRSFSLDGYVDTGTNDLGQRTETHMTYNFYVGEPSYDVLRADLVKIVAGNAKVLSSRTGIPVATGK